MERFPKATDADTQPNTTKVADPVKFYFRPRNMLHRRDAALNFCILVESRSESLRWQDIPTSLPALYPNIGAG